MWWGLLLLGMAVVGPLTESLEQRWINRKISQELSQMRMHRASGHHWDATRGRWEA